MKKRKATIRIRKDDKAVMEEMAEQFVKAWHTGKSDIDTFTFSSATQLFSVLTSERWQLIECLQAIGPSSLQKLAHTLKKGVKQVHSDTMEMLEWGFIRQDDHRKLYVPYDVIHTEFDLRTAA